LHAAHGYGAYICGEETGLLESLEGKKGQPRYKPPFPAVVGLYGKPTIINNTETLATVPWIILNGADAFLALGRPNNGGTKIFSVSGDVQRPGNFEVPLGTPFAKLLELAGGMRGGKIKAVIPGGSSMPVLPGAVMMDTDMDYDSIAKAGSMLGSGAVIVMNDTRCMVRSLERLSYFYFRPSPAGSARPAARAPAGCTASCTASSTARAAGGPGFARFGGREHPGADHLRAGRRGGACRCAPSSRTSGPSSSTTSSTSGAWCRTTSVTTITRTLLMTMRT
jgi:hypothetical protein